MTTTASPSQLEQIMTALDMADLSNEEQQEFLLELNSLIFKGSLVRLVERMDDSTRQEFSTLMDTDPEIEQVEQFLESKVENADGAVLETINDLTSDILAVMAP